MSNIGEQAERILAAMLTDPTHCSWSSSRITEAAGLKPGSIYPALIRMERLGLLESRWEDVEPPRRRLYELTPKGKRLGDAIRNLERMP